MSNRKKKRTARRVPSQPAPAQPGKAAWSRWLVAVVLLSVGVTAAGWYWIARQERPIVEPTVPIGDLGSVSKNVSAGRTPAHSDRQTGGLTRGTATSGDSPAASMATPRFQARLAAQRETLDPAQDGWDSEAISDAAGAQLKRLGQVFTQRSGLGSRRI